MTIQNYRNWNITSDCLLIPFDPYRVPAYAAGTQLVTIPYAEGKSSLDPRSPLVSLLP
jgi:hypothetical protein